MSLSSLFHFVMRNIQPEFAFIGPLIQRREMATDSELVRSQPSQQVDSAVLGRKNGFDGMARPDRAIAVMCE